MTIVHAKNRAKGSSVIATEDPSGVIQLKIKKLGHSSATLFNLNPTSPGTCQTGWSLSFTVHCLRKVDGDKSALDVYLGDLVKVYKEVQSKPPSALVGMFHEGSLAARTRAAA